MTDTECLTEGCPQDGVARGLCHRHYAQWNKHGQATPVGERTCALSECDVTFTPKRTDQAYCCGPHASKGWRRARGKPAPQLRTCARDACNVLFSTCRDWNRFCSSTCLKQYRRDDPTIRAQNAERMRERYRSNPQVRISARLKRYGLTEEQYDAMFTAQDERCAICRSPGPQSNYWHIDHDHVTGRVRGILCGFCNPAIGYFADDPERILAAAEYIKRHRRM